MVDEAGADRLGISDVAMQRDTFLVQARCAEATRRVQIGSLVSNPYLRHPAAVAAALATLNEISQLGFTQNLEKVQRQGKLA